MFISYLIIYIYICIFKTLMYFIEIMCEFAFDDNLLVK
jgi:hypothetical protein